MSINFGQEMTVLIIKITASILGVMGLEHIG